jgi:dUTP pyrophosphatase
VNPFTLEAKVQRVRDVPLPEYHSRLAAGFDLAIAEDVSLPPAVPVPAPTGLVIQAPRGHMLLIAPRSSTYKRWGVSLANTVGIVDEDFCGPEDEVRLLLVWNGFTSAENVDYIDGTDDLVIPAGSRLAQGIFVPVTRGKFIEEYSAIADNRGGWGSTGA